MKNELRINELRILYSDNGKKTNLGMAYNPDYYNRKCFYKVGDKVAVLEDYNNDMEKYCIECEVVELCEPYLLMGSGDHLYYRRTHHETIVIKFPDGRTNKYSPQYIGIVGKLITLDDYINFIIGKDLK